jgi:hypothetical protein
VRRRVLGCDAASFGGFQKIVVPSYVVVMQTDRKLLVVPKPQGEAQTIFTFTVFNRTSCTCNHFYLLGLLDT